MKTLIAALLCCAGTAALCADDINAPFEEFTEVIAPRTIQVLLEKDATEALLEVRGPYTIVNPHDQSKVASGLLGKRFMIRELEQGLKWGEEFPGIHQIVIHPRSHETSIHINGIQYPGSVAIYGIAGQINIVNEVEIEEFVKALLAPQFLSPLEPEVLSALAIVARTNAYYHATRSHNSFWHIAASDVGYQGCSLTAPESPIDRAVESTKHLILVHSKDGRELPFAAAWTEHSAGKTASYQSVFRKEGYAPEKGVEAPHAALNRAESKWSYTISKKALAKLLDLSEIKGIELFVDTPSSKVYGVRVKDTESSHDFDFVALQTALGTHHLLSNDFTLSIKDDAVVFQGYGKGHGVGLCLYSASALAQNGDNAVKILNKFFPDTYLHNLGVTMEMKSR